MNKLLFSVITHICLIWFNGRIDKLTMKQDIKTFKGTINLWVRTKGLIWTIKRIKLLRLLVTKLICGQPIMVYQELIGINKNGFPKSIQYLEKYLNMGNPGKSFLLTLLASSRAMASKPEDLKPDYSSITNPFQGTSQIIGLDFMDRFVSDYNLSFQMENISDGDYVYTGKAGPNSFSSILHAHKFYWNINGNIMNAINILSRPLILWIASARLRYPRNDTSILKDNVTRRLSLIFDPENKVRVIAIFDYFSQIILSRLSDYLFSVLKTIPQDRTFTQNPIIRNKKPSESYWSLDLSSATDRFPVLLQEQLLSKFTDKRTAWAWKILLVSEGFLTPEGSLIKYEVGQPMGAKTSWSMFTLTHHFVVQYSAYLCEQYPFKEYILLGDDIVIYNDNVAKEYMKQLTILGVEISPMKSHVSKDTYEFAKRWFHNGVEISPIPIKGIVEGVNNPINLLGYFINLYDKGFTPWKHITSLDLALSLLSKYDRKHIVNSTHTLTNMWALIRFKKGSIIELRNLMNDALINFEGELQSNDEMLLNEFRRACNLVANMTMFTQFRVINKFVKKLTDSLSNITGLDSEVVEVVKSELPINIAIYNRLDDLAALSKEIAMNRKDFDLFYFIDKITILDLDPIISRKRASERSLFHLSSFANGIFRETRFDALQLVPYPRMMMNAKAIWDVKNSFKKFFNPHYIKV